MIEYTFETEPVELATINSVFCPSGKIQSTLVQSPSSLIDVVAAVVFRFKSQIDMLFLTSRLKKTGFSVMSQATFTKPAQACAQVVFGDVKFLS